jgi:hypothetical protein
MAYLSDETFDNLFRTAEHSVFRLETRDSYEGVSYSTAPFRRWLAGEDVDQSWMRPWLDQVSAATASGIWWARVRVVSVPHSDYTRYGLWACQVNVAAGEDIRYLPRDQASELPNCDYWLFDSRTFVACHYDEHDAWLGAELIDDPSRIVQANYWRDAAWHHAVPRDDYARKVASGGARS